MKYQIFSNLLNKTNKCKCKVACQHNNHSNQIKKESRAKTQMIKIRTTDMMKAMMMANLVMAIKTKALKKHEEDEEVKMMLMEEITSVNIVTKHT